MDKDKEYQLLDARDALKHIISAVSQSRSQTRRLRWIAVRAQDGLDGTTEHQRVNLPKSAPNEIDSKIKTVKLKKDLEAAKARIAELEKALEPFAREFGQWNPEVYGDDCPITAGPIVDGYRSECSQTHFNLGDLRRAAELLEESI